MNIKGSVLRARALYLEKCPTDVKTRVLAALSPRVRAQVEDGFSVSEWYPRELSDEFSGALVDALGIGDDALLDMGRFAAEENLRGVYRVFLKIGFIQLMLRRVAQAFQVHYDAGSMRVTASTKRSAVLEMVDVPNPDQMICLPVSGWMKRGAELAGCRDVRCDITQCRRRGAKACEFSLRWI